MGTSRWPVTEGAIFVFEALDGTLLLARFDESGLIEDVQYIHHPAPGHGRSQLADWRAARWNPAPCDLPLLLLVSIAEQMVRETIALTARVARDGGISILEQKPITNGWLA